MKVTVDYIEDNTWEITWEDGQIISVKLDEIQTSLQWIVGAGLEKLLSKEKSFDIIKIKINELKKGVEYPPQLVTITVKRLNDLVRNQKSVVEK